MNIRQLFGALLRPKARRGTARRGPPQRVLGPVEPLEDRSLMAAGMWSIPIDSPTAVDVNAITGLVSVVGSNTNPTTQQSTGRLVTRSQTGNMTNVDLGHSSVASPSETPIAIRVPMSPEKNSSAGIASANKATHFRRTEKKKKRISKV